MGKTASNEVHATMWAGELLRANLPHFPGSGKNRQSQQLLLHWEIWLSRTLHYCDFMLTRLF